jgi:hypothetical protein
MASPTTHFPSGGAAANMTPSAISRFTFTGNTWPASPSGVLNWDFYSIPTGSSAQFLIGDWCSQLRGDYASVYGPNPKECQETLKVRSNGTTQEAFWLPFAKTGTPNGIPITQACGTQVVISGQTTCWDKPHVQWTDGTNNVLATFDSTSESFGGLTIVGGPEECDWNATTGTCYVSGSVAGTRTVALPVGFTITSGAVGRSGPNYTFYHPGGVSTPTYSFAFATTPVSRRTSQFAFSPPAGTATVRVKAGSSYAVSVPCLSACSASVELPAAPQSVSWEFVDGAGNVLFTSNQVTI